MQRAKVRGLSEQRAATLALLRRLPPQAWTMPCLPPWRVADVVAHLLTVDEAVVTGRLLPVLLRGSPADVEAWNDAAVLRVADLGPRELEQRLQRAGGRLAAVARRVPPGIDRVRLPTPWGRLSAHALLSRRVLDEWVHTADIAAATGVTAPLAAGVGDALASGVLATLPALVLPRTGRPVGVLRMVVGTGAAGGWQVPRRTWGVDFARRQYGPRVAAAPDATVHVHATTLALLAERRLQWRSLPPGSLVVEGDEPVAAALLDALATA